MDKNRNSLKKATIGTSLLMSTILLCGNTAKAHAQADLTDKQIKRNKLEKIVPLMLEFREIDKKSRIV